MIGIVAAVLAVLKVLAMTSSAPRRNRKGDIPASTSICTRYQVTWSRQPQRDDRDQPDQRVEDRHPLLLADDSRPRPRRPPAATRATTQSSTFIKQLEADRQQVDDDLERRLALRLLAVADLHQSDAQGQREDDELRQVVLGERLADAAGDQVDEQLGDRSSGRGGWAAAAGPLSEAPTPGRIRFVSVRPMIMATSVLSR